VVVTDREGNPFENLTSDDFEVYEDGVEQSIEHFEFERIGSPSGTAPELQAYPGGDATSALFTNRTFLIVFGRGRQTQFGSLDKLIRFVEAFPLSSPVCPLRASVSQCCPASQSSCS
jgi:hypothetical protein